MYNAYRDPSQGEPREPRFKLTALKRAKPGIRGILLAAANTTSAWTNKGSGTKEIVKVDSNLGDTWYTK